MNVLVVILAIIGALTVASTLLLLLLVLAGRGRGEWPDDVVVDTGRFPLSHVRHQDPQ